MFFSNFSHLFDLQENPNGNDPENSTLFLKFLNFHFFDQNLMYPIIVFEFVKSAGNVNNTGNVLLIMLTTIPTESEMNKLKWPASCTHDLLNPEK